MSIFKKPIDDQMWIVFWLGLLTGAMLVTLVFTYQTIENQNYENALLRLRTQSTSITMPNEVTSPTTSITMPNE